MKDSCFFIFFGLMLLLGCKSTKQPVVESRLDLSKISPINSDSTINILIEIPAGTTAKYELNKSTSTIQIDSINGRPRYISYLGYVGNYGMIPNTLLDKNKGGDGDPLDVLLLGRSVNRESIQKGKLIGVLKLLDQGEQDDKLIAVPLDWPILSLSELDENYPGIRLIVETFFVNYKGKGKMALQSWGDKQEALKILQASLEVKD